MSPRPSPAIVEPHRASTAVYLQTRIEKALKDGSLTRGVLIDMAAFHGVPCLEPGTPIHAKELEAWKRNRKQPS